MSVDKRKQNFIDNLYRFEEKGVSRTHIECLIWFNENKNKIVNNDALQGEKVQGKSKKGNSLNARKPIPPNNIVHNQHYIHAGIRGWYKPKGQRITGYDKTKNTAQWEGEGMFVQSLQTGKSGSLKDYGEEIKYNKNGTLWEEINYNHNPNSNYFEISGGYIDRCYKLKLPVGIILKLKKGKNKIMGLGLITKISEDKLDYTIKPFEPYSQIDTQFQFVNKDFEKTGSTNKTDAKYRYDRFSELHKPLKSSLSTNFNNYNSFIGKWIIVKTVSPYTWLAFYEKEHDRYDGFQLQVYIEVDSVENKPMLNAGFRIEGKSKDKKNRNKILDVLSKKNQQTFEHLKNFPSDYHIILKNKQEDLDKDWDISTFTETDFYKYFIPNLDNKNTQITISKKFSQQDSIDLETDVVNEISSVFETFVPFVKFVNGENVSITNNSEVSLDEIANKILKGPPEIAVEKNIVLRILKHLESGKHVILVGAPGVGKTMLSKRILEIYGKIKTGEEYLPSVATAEWSRYHVIGGINLQQDTWNTGVVSKAAESGKWLLIDEFNRADINKAFGEMFFAIEDKKIPLTDEEQKISGKKEIIIPDEFRMIGTMNDYDKNLLLTELSYGLITRFAFIDIEPDKNKEKESVKNQIITGNLDIDNEDWENCKKEINNYFEFVEKVRQIPRMIGVRTTIDILRYVIYSSKSNDGKASNNKVFLDEALCDYLLPQFDRLDKNTIVETEKASKSLGTEKFTSGLTKMKEDLKKMSGILDDEDD